MEAILSLTNVSKSYGALKVTDNISFNLSKGETLGILGPNGAGKTTLFNLISGDVRADTGAVHFRSKDITKLPPQNRCHMGIGRSYQIPHPFGGMTVFENLLVGATFGGQMSEDEADPICIDILRKTKLLPKANLLAGSLTLLDRKRLELARALATRPDVLLLDEIAGGLTEQEAHELVALIKDIKSEGVSMIWIEHVVHALLAVADRLLVINFGARLAEGDPESVMNNSDVKRVYMGIEV